MCCCWSACSRVCTRSGTCAASRRRSANSLRCWSDTRWRRKTLGPRLPSRDSPPSCRTPYSWVYTRYRSRRFRNRTRWTGRICVRVPLKTIIIIEVLNNNCVRTQESLGTSRLFSHRINERSEYYKSESFFLAIFYVRV